MNASQAVNILFDRLIEEGSADFLLQDGDASADERWASAARFVDSLSAQALNTVRRYDEGRDQT